MDIEEILLEHLVVKARIFFYFLFFIFYFYRGEFKLFGYRGRDGGSVSGVGL